MLRSLRRQPAQRLGRDIRADAVVEATGDDAAVGVFLYPAVQHAGVTDANAPRRLVPVGGADVDP